MNARREQLGTSVELEVIGPPVHALLPGGAPWEYPPLPSGQKGLTLRGGLVALSCNGMVVDSPFPLPLLSRVMLSFPLGSDLVYALGLLFARQNGGHRLYFLFEAMSLTSRQALSSWLVRACAPAALSLVPKPDPH